MNRPMVLLDLSPESVSEILTHIQILPGQPDKCWLWRGGINKKSGYGYFSNAGRYWVAHRAVYFILTQRDPGPLLVCHTCDVRHCCNPRHMFLGTHDDNQKDMANKGRAAKGDRHSWRTKPERMIRGEQSHHAKLTDAQVIEIRSLYATAQFTQQELGARFKVAGNTIGHIVRGEKWKHLPFDPALLAITKPRRGFPGQTNPMAKLTDAQVVEIRRSLATGETGTSIASRYGVSDALIYAIKKGKRHTI